MKDQIESAKKIREEYTYRPKNKTNYEKLIELNKKVKKPVKIFSYILGTVGALLLGTGMSISMGVIGGLMPVGIAIGVVGLGISALTYPLYKKILEIRKNKYSSEILKLSKEVIEYSEYKQSNEENKLIKINNEKNEISKTLNNDKTLEK